MKDTKRRKEAAIQQAFDNEIARLRIARLREWIGPVQPYPVDAEKERRATEIVRWAAAKWGVKPPRVAFFRPRPGLTKAGYFCPDQPHLVWLRHDLDGWPLVEIAIHETSHAAYNRVGVRDPEEEIVRATKGLLRWYRSELAARRAA